jgi:hypothetical protein
MYGHTSATAAGGTAVLAYTGLNVGWTVTAALGLIFAGVALLQLVRRQGPVRP